MKRIVLVLMVVVWCIVGCGPNARCPQFPDYPIDNEGLRYDPKGRDPKLAAAFAAAEKFAEKECVEWEGKMGSFSCFILAKRKFLKEQHSIDWKTPEELNPCIVFD